MRAIVFFGLVMFITVPVFAMGEDERVIQIRASGDLTPKPGLRGGAGLGLALAKGLSDSFGIRVGADLAWLPKRGNQPHYLSNISLCAFITMDTLAWVPYADLGLLATDFRSGDSASQWLGTRMEVGMEYLWSPRTSFTLAARADWLVFRLTGKESDRPIHMAFLFSASRFF
jgi:hypothetical protein